MELDTIIQGIALWAFLGYFFIIGCPTPRNRIGAIIFLIVGGPIGWVIFIPCSIEVWIQRRREKKGETK